MRILYIADGRSPIALNWMSHFIQAGYEVHLASTYPCQPVDGVESMHLIPVAMSDTYGTLEGGRINRDLGRKLIPVSLRTRIKQLLAPWSFPQAARAVRQVIVSVQPDLIHAMRIPFEGMITSMAIEGGIAVGGSPDNAPLIVSVWGNDFTLHARSTRRMDYFTRQTLRICDAIHTDCQRDLRLSRELGFASTKPTIVLPGAGGVRLDIFYPPIPKQRGEEAEQPLVRIINPRGFRAYVSNDTFFQAVPLVLKKYPDVHFLCPNMAGEARAQKYVSELGVVSNVELLPMQSQQGMADLFRSSAVSLSITTHDGTPNTLLEAMACGCFPIAGDLESIREWITPGENGFLVDPGDAKALAEAIVSAITQPAMRQQVKERNLLLVKERGEYEKTMLEAEVFYQAVIAGNS